MTPPPRLLSGSLCSPNLLTPIACFVLFFILATPISSSSSRPQQSPPTLITTKANANRTFSWQWKLATSISSPLNSSQADGKSEDGVTKGEGEAIDGVDIGNSRGNGEEAEGEGRRNPEDGQAELGPSRKSEKSVCGESNLKGTRSDQRSHLKFPTQHKWRAEAATEKARRSHGGKWVCWCPRYYP